MRSRQFLTSLLVSLFVCLLVSGCGSSKSTVPVSGEATLDNEPISEGVIQFMPLGPGSPDMAQIQAGKYSVKLPPGRFNAVLTATKETGKMITEYSEPYPERVSIIPARYTSGIEFEVSSPETKQDFRLSSQ